MTAPDNRNPAPSTHPQSDDVHLPRERSTVLIGLRGSGKTTLGSLLADAQGVPFIDLDTVTLRNSGAQSISEMFKAFGASAFRDAECTALAKVLDAHSFGGAVIALGGGTPTAPGAAALLTDARKKGAIRIVLLDAPAAVLGARLMANPGDRPLLAGDSFESEAKILAAERLPSYRELAESVISCDGNVQESLAQLLKTICD